MSVPETVDHVLLTGAVVLVVLAGALLLVRIWKGPSMLDRAISLDVCAALIIAGLGAKSALARDPYYFPIMLVLAFLGFTGSVGIARFIAVRDRPPPRGPRRADPEGAREDGPRGDGPREGGPGTGRSDSDRPGPDRPGPDRPGPDRPGPEPEPEPEEGPA